MFLSAPSPGSFGYLLWNIMTHFCLCRTFATQPLEFSELKELKFDLALTGFEPGEVQTSLTKLAWKTAALTEEDALPPAPAQPVTRVDDIWVMGPHRVACGDATETEPVDRLMRGEKTNKSSQLYSREMPGTSLKVSDPRPLIGYATAVPFAIGLSVAAYLRSRGLFGAPTDS
jgi:hypothetical protein